ncbi:MAG: VOC family protein [Armatimonadetes bacterium]|nr:VOC family protein [Armatimonadota bacterium]
MPRVTGLTPIVSVSDVDRSVAFYESLGFETLNKIQWEGQTSWAALRRDGANLMLGLGHTHDEEGNTLPMDHSHGHRECILYLRVEDVAGMRDDLLARGHAPSELEVQFYGMKETHVEDPDGYLIIFGENTDEPPSQNA